MNESIMVHRFYAGYRAAAELVFLAIRPVRRQPGAALCIRQVRADRSPGQHHWRRGQRDLGSGGGRRRGRGELGRVCEENELSRRGEV